jgi:adenosylcobinamide amidohydrolase
MNLEKLKDLESEFLERYPKGFEDAHFFPTMKKFKPEKLEEFAKEALKKENFSKPEFAPIVHACKMEVMPTMEKKYMKRYKKMVRKSLGMLETDEE